MTFPRVYNETRGATRDRGRRGMAVAFRTDNENDGVRRNSIRHDRGRNFVALASLLISFEKRRKPLLDERERLSKVFDFGALPDGMAD